MRSFVSLSALLFAAAAVPLAPARADAPPFDLAGPTLRAKVTRDGVTLPIGQVPALAAGDTIEIGADLPSDQSAKYMLVSAFLHGATNPPSTKWIDKAETWKKKDKDRLLKLTVPEGARQLVLFMVPETGGDYGSVTKAVRGKPGEFVRAAQELNQASLDRSRLDTFMAAIRAQENLHPEYLKRVAPVLASSLSTKLNAECLQKVIELQANCLLENRESLVLADVHTSSMTETLVGAPTDLALQISSTRVGGQGYYSAYIAVARDLAKIFGAFNSPQFDYLPALGLQRDDKVSLMLNSAPSFTAPKSVLVVAMPTVEADQPPPLRNGADGAICATRPGLVLPVEGAPLIYSTGYARDATLQLTAANGSKVEVPLTARADRGGYVVSDPNWRPEGFGTSATGHLRAIWGFKPFDGPDFALQFATDAPWRPLDENVVVGRDNVLRLKGDAAACVDSISLRQPNSAPRPLTWKTVGGDMIAVDLPLKDARPGELTLEIRRAGIDKTAAIPVRAFSEASRLDTLTLHAGDDWAVLAGRRLDQVANVEIGGRRFRPDGLTREGDSDRLRIVAEGGAGTAKPEAGASLPAKIALDDGRNVGLSVRVAEPRVQVALVGKSIAPAGEAPALPLVPGSPDVLPDTARLTFSLRAPAGIRFGTGDAIDIATADDRIAAKLSAGRGLQLESAEILIANVDAAALGPSSFGPLRFRVVRQGVTGDWQPLATLVRQPRIDAIYCTAENCEIRGSRLFLIDAVSATPDFSGANRVPQGFTGGVFTGPLAADGKLYLRLRDAPELVHSIVVPAAKP
ncbi:hypothetical protein FHS96_002627 [Sphingomonas zeicaulis]|uniref:hypothetical protein n=1 Tax=Sphingomonas zeicaulis TaxID=1632740 RepID=UPI003D1CB9E1